MNIPVVNVCIGVPFYKNPSLAILCLTRLGEINTSVNNTKINLNYIFVNDSPDDIKLNNILNENTHKFKNKVTIIKNELNIGFLKSANKIFQQSKLLNAHCLILNSDAMLTLEALQEMLALVLLDNRIRFVFPRSNNATIASIKPTNTLIPFESEEDCYSFFKKCSPLFPRYTYTPTAVGFCLLIHSDVLLNNYLFDEQYGLGYEEENDLIMRVCNLGYRCVMANHAFVYHIGSVSFQTLDGSTALQNRKNENSNLINKIHPYYRTLVADYIESKYFHAEKFIFNAASKSRKIIFDLMNSSAITNGTNRVAINILKNVVLSNKFEQVYVWTSQEVIEYLKQTLPSKISESITYTTTLENLYVDVLFRPGQPFDLKQLLAARLASRVLIYYFFDTIATDCPYLKRKELDEIWRTMINVNAVPIFLSNYTRLQFNNLYSTTETNFLNAPVVYPAFTTDLIRHSTIGAIDSNDTTVLIFGNLHAHKYLEKTVHHLLDNTNVKIIITSDFLLANDRLTQFKSGHLTDALLAKIINDVDLIIYPSHYEGFGLVITEAIGMGKKILCRKLDPYTEILNKINFPVENLFFYETDADFIEQLNKALLSPPPSLPVHDLYDWNDCTDNILSIIQSEIEKFDITKLHDGLELALLLKSQYIAGFSDATNQNLIQMDGKNFEVINQLKKELFDIKKSRSWRATQPVRSIILQVKKITSLI